MDSERRFFLVPRDCWDLKTKVLRYEDFVYDKLRLVTEVDGWFGLGLSEATRGEIAAAHSQFPGEERPDQHMRQAHPGDFRRKLKRETIAALNGVLIDYLRTFGYADPFEGAQSAL